MLLLEKKKKSAKQGGKGKSSGKKRSTGKRTLLFNLAAGLLAVLSVVLLLLYWLQSSRSNLPYTPSPGSKPVKPQKSVIRQVEQPATPAKKSAAAARIASSEPEPAAGGGTYHAVEKRRAVAKVPPARPVPQSDSVRVAIVMDDLGADLGVMRELLALDLAVTPAILPHLAHSRETAKLARAAGREVMLHLPMEPRDYPHVNPGPEPLLVGLSTDELQQRLQGYFAEVPGAVGANNHMGSRFTEESAGMDVVLQTLRQRHLYFVDSLTSSASVGYAAAQRLGVPSVERDVFLDNEQSVAAIRQQLQLLRQQAKEHGQALGICHPYRETLTALQLELPALTAAGITVVPVSQLLAD